MNNEKLWGRISTFLILAYIVFGGGYEIYSAFINHHVQASLPFSALSCAIFIGRIFYAMATKATRTLFADILGAAVMLNLSMLHLYFN